ncbi:MAG: hypothetical protein K6E18_04770, partial [Lachnospiraceae bacterium]|nr:hypothetical protein [Lachnospiraceae bacterium]
MDRKKGRARWRKPYRRLLAFVMALIVSFSIMPQTTFAYIGAIRGNAKGDKLRTGNFENKKDGRKYIYLENDYIHFDLCISHSPKFGTSILQNVQKLAEVGKIAHTIPTSVMKDMKEDDLDSFGVQEIKHQISTPADLTLDEKYQGMNKVSFATLAERDSLEWRDVPTLAVKSYGRAKDYEGSLIEDGIYVSFLVQENREMLNP